MAILATVETVHGEKRELYIRVNSVDTNNHGQKSSALMRGFASKKAFEEGKHYMYEQGVEFDADVSGNLWQQAYIAFCEQYEIKDKKEK